MPRLLLVDDNPSIHKIAETLLAHSAIELVCVESAAEALDLVGRGERFEMDPLAFLGDLPHPFCWLGLNPTLFDAPSRSPRVYPPAPLPRAIRDG